MLICTICISHFWLHIGYRNVIISSIIRCAFCKSREVIKILNPICLVIQDAVLVVVFRFIFFRVNISSLLLCELKREAAVLPRMKIKSSCVERSSKITWLLEEWHSTRSMPLFVYLFFSMLPLFSYPLFIRLSSLIHIIVLDFLISSTK